MSTFGNIQGLTSSSGMATSGMATSGTASLTGLESSSIGIGKLLPGISASSASAGTGTGMLAAGLAVVGSALLTGAVFAGVGLLTYAITKAAIES
jgi:hypothetical protein